MKDNADAKHKRRKLAWESLVTPRVSWEDFKRIESGSSSLEQAKMIAKTVALRKHKRK